MDRAVAESAADRSPPFSIRLQPPGFGARSFAGRKMASTQNASRR
jgi:hypothetical protein